MSKETLVVGFGPFGDISPNPSALLAECCGCDHVILPVTFSAADQFVESLQGRDFGRLLLMGVSGGASKFRVELAARNKISATPDTEGNVKGPSSINEASPAILGTTLFWTPALLYPNERFELSTDAGGYLCNYLYFRCLEALQDRRVGFLHVPKLEKMAFGTQLDFVQFVLSEIESPQSAMFDESLRSQ